MGKFNFINNSFTSGEITPRLQGRTDLQQYGNAAKTIKNGVVHPSGGVSRRSGTRFVDDIGLCRLIPFVYSKDESYMIALPLSVIPPSVTYTILVYTMEKPHSRYEVIAELSAISGGGTVFSGYSNSLELEEIQFAQVGDILYLVHPNHEPIAMVRQPGGGFLAQPWYDAISVPVDLSGSPDKGNWESWPYQAVNTQNIQLSSSGLGAGVITLTASAPYFDDPNDLMNHSIIKINHATVGYFYITDVTSTTTANGYWLTPPDSTLGTRNWQASSWSDYAGWPRSVAIDGQRLIFGGSASFPDTLWYSKFENVRVMERPNTGADILSAFDATISSSNQVNQIQWLSAGKQLQVGTSGSEYIAGPRDSSLVVGAPDNLPLFEADSNNGSSYVQPVRYEGAALFVQRGGLKLLEMAFDFNEQSYRTDNLTILGDHVLKDRLANITDPASLQRFIALAHTDSSSIIWSIDDTYGLFGVSRDRTNNTVGWHTHDLGGTDIKIRSIATAPGEGDELWMCVERTINGGTEYYIEAMVDEYFHDDIGDYIIGSQRRTPHFSDSSLALFNAIAFTALDSGVDIGADSIELDRDQYGNITDGVKVTYTSDGGAPITGLTVGNDYYIVNSNVSFGYNFAYPLFDNTSGTIQLSLTQGGAAIDLTGAGTGPHTFTIEPTTTIFGRLGHLEGEEVAIVADGAWAGYKTVTGGQITLDAAAANVVIGLNYNTNIETLPVEGGGQFGTAQGSVKRIDEVIFRFYRTIGATYGRSSDSLDGLIFRPSDLPMNEPIPMFTGDKDIEMLGDWDRLGVLYVRQDIPLPFTLTSVVLRGVTNDS